MKQQNPADLLKNMPCPKVGAVISAPAEPYGSHLIIMIIYMSRIQSLSAIAWISIGRIQTSYEVGTV